MSKTALALEPTIPRQDAIQRSIESALAAIQSDVSLTVPRNEEERHNAFADWLTAKRRQYEAVMQQAVREALASQDSLTRREEQRLIEQCVWPQMRGWLHSYALRGQAAAYVIQYLGDALTIGEPEHRGEYWHIPLGLREFQEPLGFVVLDENGTVNPSLTSTRDELLARADDLALSVAATSAGQQ
jgi:hypothetical protein